MHLNLSIALELGDIAQRGCMPQALVDETMRIAMLTRAGDTPLADVREAVTAVVARLSARHITAKRRFSRVLETLTAAAQEVAAA